MTIRLDKCVSYGMQKRNGLYQQYKPNVSLVEGYIPTVEIGGQFLYLGKSFNFEGNESQAKEALEKKLSDMLKVTDLLKINIQDKMKILSLFIHSQMIFEPESINFRFLG
jgi:hypothetical protein